MPGAERSPGLRSIDLQRHVADEHREIGRRRIRGHLIEHVGDVAAVIGRVVGEMQRDLRARFSAQWLLSASAARPHMRESMPKVWTGMTIGRMRFTNFSEELGKVMTGEPVRSTGAQDMVPTCPAPASMPEQRRRSTLEFQRFQLRADTAL